MTTILLVIHLLIALGLIGVVLLQRSEGGALGIGGGAGGGGSMFSSRGAANLLTRMTAVLAMCFFITSMVLTIMARGTSQPSSVFDSVQPQQSGSQSGDTSGGGNVLPNLPGTLDQSTPQAPVTE